MSNLIALTFTNCNLCSRSYLIQALHLNEIVEVFQHLIDGTVRIFNESCPINQAP